jgi:hypothetical protein
MVEPYRPQITIEYGACALHAGYMIAPDCYVCTYVACHQAAAPTVFMLATDVILTDTLIVAVYKSYVVLFK